MNPNMDIDGGFALLTLPGRSQIQLDELVADCGGGQDAQVCEEQGDEGGGRVVDHGVLLVQVLHRLQGVGLVLGGGKAGMVHSVNGRRSLTYTLHPKSVNCRRPLTLLFPLRAQTVPNPSIPTKSVKRSLTLLYPLRA